MSRIKLSSIVAGLSILFVENISVLNNNFCYIFFPCSQNTPKRMVPILNHPVYKYSLFSKKKAINRTTDFSPWTYNKSLKLNYSSLFLLSHKLS